MKNTLLVIAIMVSSQLSAKENPKQMEIKSVYSNFVKLAEIKQCPETIVVDTSYKIKTSSFPIVNTRELDNGDTESLSEVIHLKQGEKRTISACLNDANEIVLKTEVINYAIEK